MRSTALPLVVVWWVASWLSVVPSAALAASDASSLPATQPQPAPAPTRQPMVAPPPAAGHPGAPHTPAPRVPTPAPGKPTVHGLSKPNGRGAGTTRVVESPPDPSMRQRVAGGPTSDDTALGPETPELRGLLAAERELFPPAAPAIGQAFPNELSYRPLSSTNPPRIHATGLPPAPSPTESLRDPAQAASGTRDISWMSKVVMPDLPIRWEARLVKYIEFFKDDPRGRGTITFWIKRAGRYRAMIRRTLRRKGLPEDLSWLAMVESGYDASVFSPVAAAGLWQFMPESGRVYGLGQDRWADQRLSPSHSTEAATDYLSDLQRRFGSWDLAMAAYNMGYGGVLSVVKRYNTNDFWQLAELEGALPWETTLYVPKILAAAVVAKNLALFGFKDLVEETSLEGEEVLVPPQTTLAYVAQSVHATPKEIEALNPELRAGRTPPLAEYAVHVPQGRAIELQNGLAKGAHIPTLPTVAVRTGDTLDLVAARTRVPAGRLIELNHLTRSEPLRPGMALLVPVGTVISDAPQGDKTPVTVPSEVFVYPDRKRLFHRVVVGDTLDALASRYRVLLEELRLWNGTDPQARLQEGMFLQIFAPLTLDLSTVAALGEEDVHLFVAGTDDFFLLNENKGRQRLVVVAKPGDTLTSLSKKYDVSIALAERINRRPRTEPLAPGTNVVFYVQKMPPGQSGQPGAAHAGLTPASLHSRGLPPRDLFVIEPFGPLPEFPERQPALP